MRKGSSEAEATNEKVAKNGFRVLSAPELRRTPSNEESLQPSD